MSSSDTTTETKAVSCKEEAIYQVCIETPPRSLGMRSFQMERQMEDTLDKQQNSVPAKKLQHRCIRLDLP